MLQYAHKPARVKNNFLQSIIFPSSPSRRPTTRLLITTITFDKLSLPGDAIESWFYCVNSICCMMGCESFSGARYRRASTDVHVYFRKQKEYTRKPDRRTRLRVPTSARTRVAHITSPCFHHCVVGVDALNSQGDRLM